MENIIYQIDQLSETLQQLLPIQPEYQKKLDKKFRLEYNYNSNHLEGNTLTYGETELLLYFNKTDGPHELREFEEMRAHDVAYKMVNTWANEKNFQLAEIHIKQLNELILVRPFWKEAVTPDGQPTRRLIKIGDYKEFPNSVKLQNGEIFEYASPLDTPIKMAELMSWYNESLEKKTHPVALAAEFHHRFVLIHPFDDGNGRISRLLVNFILLRNNLPPIIIKTADKKNYLNALNQADVGNMPAFVKYIAEQVLWSLNTAIKVAKGENIDEPDDVDKEIAVFKKELIAKESIRGVIRTNELVAKLYIEKLKLIFDFLFEKHKEIDELFAQNNYNRRINGSYDSKQDIDRDYINDKFKTIEAHKQDIYEIAIGIHHLGFLKDGLNTFDVHFNEYIKFDMYKYHIGQNHKPRVSFLYSDLPTDEQLLQVARDIMKDHLDEIKKRIG